MNALEAMTRLIEVASSSVKGFKEEVPDGNKSAEDLQWIKDTETATAVCQAMLNTAIPIARFRMHVSMPESMPDFTVSSPSVKALVEVLQIIRERKKNQLITASLWEQHATKAEMLHGFEGNTRADGFKYWIQQVKASEHGAQVQAVIPEDLPHRRSKAEPGEDASGGTEASSEEGS